VRRLIAAAATLTLLLLGHQAFAASLPDSCSPDEIDDTPVKATNDTVKMYPSLTPRSVVLAAYGQFLAAHDTVAAERNTSWALVTEQSGKLVPEAHPRRVDVQGLEKGRVAQLFFDEAQVDPKKVYRLVIATQRLVPGTTGRRAICTMFAGELKFTQQDPFTIKIKPTLAPNADLVGGGTSNVGRLELDLDVPSLIPNDFANLYFNGSALLSTNERDAKTKIETKLGLERSLFESWFTPVHLDVKYIGNQRGSDQSVVASLGLETIFPWAWTAPFLWNDVVKAPVSPTVDASAEYERILKEDSTKSRRYQSRLAAGFHWNPIYLFPGLLPRLVGGPDVLANNVSLDIKAKLWGFPEEKRNDGNFRDPFEYRVELSLIIPTPMLNVNKEITHLLKGVGGGGLLGGSARVVLKYITGADESNGFRNSSDFAFKLEFVK
jgi:hypothetical protein